MRGRRRAVLAVTLGVILVGVPLVASGAPSKKPRTELVSRKSQSQGGTSANASSYPSVISGNGRFVAFTSEATNLGARPGVSSNAYLYDRKRDRLAFIARRGKRKADAESHVNGISATGRFVAFSTSASNLGGPTQGQVNVYVYDRRRDRLQLVSRRGGKNGQGANGDSFDAGISASGRFVTFTSDATNLGAAAGAAHNVYVYDRDKRRLQMVSRASGPGGAPANGDSGRPSLSGNGRFVAYTTLADNLGGQLNTDPLVDEGNVYLYDRKRKRTRLVSQRAGVGGDDDSTLPDVSATGRFVAFKTFAQNLGGPIQTDANIYVYDRRGNRLQLVSRQGGPDGAGADAVSYFGSISASGRLVAFDSEATNLGGPTNTAPAEGNIYLYDRESRRLSLISRRSGRNGTGADGPSYSPSISASGRFIAFDSVSSNLSPAAIGPPFASIYVRDRGR